jgi:hypothetical protein
VNKNKRKRRRGKARAQAVQATTSNHPKQCPQLRGIITSASKKPKPDLQIAGPSPRPRPPSRLSEKNESDQPDEHQSASSQRSEDINQWTKVTKKRRSRGLPPCWKLKVPVHLRDSLSSSTCSTDSEGTDHEQSDHHSDASVMSHPQPTPVASRTRSRVKHFRDT